VRRLALAAVTVLCLSACGGSGREPAPAAAASKRPPTSAARAPAAPATTARAPSAAPATTTDRGAPGAAPARRPHRARRRSGPSPGSLPQTAELPSAATPEFHARMRALWAAIVTGAAGRALPAFFPLGAYEQLKAIGDAAGDWRERLVGDFDLDIAAAHALVGPRARLIGVAVPGAYAHWVPPGVCYNRVGYYEVPNSRVLYAASGQERSFGIASMISWRGQWYVVHLGAILRSTTGGVVDSPATGPGVSVASSTC